MSITHLVIPDTQVKPGTSRTHIQAAGRLARDKRPSVIVVIGDWWDFPSLSSYDRGTTSAEGRRYLADLEAGNEAMKMFLKEALRSRSYNPKLHFTLGNHEHRADRHMAANPNLDGVLGTKNLYLPGFKVHKFLDLAVVDGITYSHYFANPFSGRPYGGSINNMISKIGFSFTMGHVQKLEIGRKDLANGRAVQGLVAGAFYTHDEDYKGPQGNPHWRGLVMKHNVSQGEYDLETFSIKRLKKLYG